MILPDASRHSLAAWGLDERTGEASGTAENNASLPTLNQGKTDSVGRECGEPHAVAASAEVSIPENEDVCLQQEEDV